MSDRSQANDHSVNKIFGDALPEITKDEWDDSPSDREADRDDWLRENVPPHHG
ncbi:hypothetical protein [Mycolicibacterium sp.]|uniref:hypothetical protein n=1 Tax=Mycolicibacterium sp. TaxID=2320850 RepID=UPI001A208227|nr:hypothetical protein [Mycolicibacterium sp.]MBJ7337868.1 hypothetical protein [Mycolicibacterium sp.]